MEPATTTVLGGLIALIINGVLLWIREWQKHKTWRQNGEDLKEIKLKVDCVDKKMGETKVVIAEVKVAVDAQNEQCGKTVTRFDKAISEQGREIIKLAGRKR